MKSPEIDTLYNKSQIWSVETRTRINEEMIEAIKNRKLSQTQSEVAKMFGIGRKRIINFENGKFDFNIYDQYKALFI